MKKLLLLTTVLTALMVSIPAAHADPLDKSSPKISHGMYRDRGKSSPKIAHGMYRDRGKSSPKIAEGMRSDVAGHLLIEATGIRKSPTPTRGRLEHGPGLRK